MIVDTSALYAYFVRDAPDHWAIAAEIELVPRDEKLLVSPFVVAELESVIVSRFGADGWAAALEELGGGAWHIAPLNHSDLDAMADELARRPGINLAVASVLVLASQEGAGEIASVRSYPA